MGKQFVVNRGKSLQGGQTIIIHVEDSDKNDRYNLVMSHQEAAILMVKLERTLADERITSS